MVYRIKYLFSVCILAIIISLLLTKTTKTLAISTYSDVPDDAWYTEYLQTLSDSDIIQGFPDGTFRPEEPVTRVQFIALLSRCSKADLTVYHSTDPLFSDISDPSAWYYDAVQWAGFNKITLGVNNSCFAAEEPITRQEVAVLMIRYMESMGFSAVGATLSYTDSNSIASWASKSIQKCTQLSIMEGSPANQFYPTAICTRGETAKVITQLNNTIKNCDIPSITDIKVCHYGYGMIVREFKVNLETGICYDYNSYDMLPRDENAENEGYEISTTVIGSPEDFRFVLNQASVLSWEPKYVDINPISTDVPIVEVTFYFDNSSYKRISCEGMYPVGWNTLKIALTEYIGFDVLFYGNDEE